jgi:heat shock protein HspQ
MTPFEPFERSSSMAQNIPLARFGIGDVVRHKLFDFRGVIFDVDPVFTNSDEWYDSIPEALRPSKEQPFYHLLAENSETAYIAYVSQQNLVADETDEPVEHPAIETMFERLESGGYRLRDQLRQ